MHIGENHGLLRPGGTKNLSNLIVWHASFDMVETSEYKDEAGSLPQRSL